MICKQCGSRLRGNNQCSKCGYDNHYYVEKLPKHLEQLDKFMLEGIYGEDETSEAEDISDMAQKPVNPQAVVTARCSGNRQKPVNPQVVVTTRCSGNRQNLVKADNQQNTGNRQNSLKADNPQNTYDSQNTANQQNATRQMQQRNLQTPATPQRSGKGPFMFFGIVGIVCIAIVAVTVGFFVGRDHKDSTVIAGQTQDTEMMSVETETDKSVESETQKTWVSETGNTLESDMNETEKSETSQQSNYGDGYAESGNGTGKEQNNRNDRNLPGSGTGGSGISEQYNTETDADPIAETGRLRY